jgi:hypothetical protein
MTVDAITDDTGAVLVADTLVITDRRGQRLFLSRVDDRYRLVARAGVDIDRHRAGEVVEFLGGESLARDLERTLQEAGKLRARVAALEAVLRDATESFVDHEADADSWFFAARVALGLDGATGHRDVNAEVSGG